MPPPRLRPPRCGAIAGNGNAIASGAELSVTSLRNGFADILLAKSPNTIFVRPHGVQGSASMPSMSFQPRAGDYGFDLDKALSSVVGLHSIIPPDAFSAEPLGTERTGNGVLIDDG